MNAFTSPHARRQHCEAILAAHNRFNEEARLNASQAEKRGTQNPYSNIKIFARKSLHDYTQLC